MVNKRLNERPFAVLTTSAAKPALAAHIGARKLRSVEIARGKAIDGGFLDGDA
jgi:hypothetical protein